MPRILIPPKLEAGKKVKNRVSGEVNRIDKVSPVSGWFRLEGEKGWVHRRNYLVKRSKGNDDSRPKNCRTLKARKRR